MPHSSVAAHSIAAATAEVDRSPAAALANARAQHLQLLTAQRLQPQAASLTNAWTAVGPLQVQSASYGLVTGRVTAVALDPNDTTGNTAYIGTSGGGVWKSTNAAGAASSVSFAPLTDILPVFSPNAGGSVVPSLSIGAVSVQPGGTGVILAGTGDPNDAADSYYGAGLLRSTDNGVTWALVQNTKRFLRRRGLCRVRLEHDVATGCRRSRFDRGRGGSGRNRWLSYRARPVLLAGRRIDLARLHRAGRQHRHSVAVQQLQHLSRQCSDRSHVEPGAR